ncbi:ubiquitin C-terminal hydrolase Ubp14, partial [Coemansia nantahalensis]
PAAAAAGAAVDPDAVEQLAAMGFPHDAARKALAKAGGDTGRALDRLLSGADDDGDDNNTAAASAAAAGDESAVSTQFELTGFVSHKGSSVHCGHYVASVRHGLGDETQWFLINDARVAAQPTPEPEHAYLLFFTRTE